ncbi:MAG: GNAT family N-acetyltransferase [Lachnospirales bacterium]
MIEVLSQKDRADCAKMFVRVFKEEPFNYNFINYEMATKYIGGIFKDPSFRGYKFIENDIVLGYCLGSAETALPNPQYHIKEIYMDLEVQNKGYGSRFLSYIELDLANIGMYVMSLYTNKLVPAYEFYLKNDYMEIKDTVHFMKVIKNKK